VNFSEFEGLFAGCFRELEVARREGELAARETEMDLRAADLEVFRAMIVDQEEFVKDLRGEIRSQVDSFTETARTPASCPQAWCLPRPFQRILCECVCDAVALQCWNVLGTSRASCHSSSPQGSQRTSPLTLMVFPDLQSKYSSWMLTPVS
jgi:hypothetical protein